MILHLTEIRLILLKIRFTMKYRQLVIKKTVIKYNRTDHMALKIELTVRRYNLLLPTINLTVEKTAGNIKTL